MEIFNLFLGICRIWFLLCFYLFFIFFYESFAHPDLRSTLKPDESIEAVKKIILDNRQITIGEIADDIAISLGSCQTIFAYVLVIKTVTSKIIVKLLNFKQT